MLPIVRVDCIKAYSPMSCQMENFQMNVCIDKNGKEVVWHGDGYYFINKNKTVSKRKSNAW
jgi:hypothetical protein